MTNKDAIYNLIEFSFFELAFKEAKSAADNNEVPVGCVIVKDNKVISSAQNQILTLNDPTAHAEILAIRSACKALNTERLVGCSMFVTLEPCTMCSGAIILSRLEKVNFLCYDEKLPAFREVSESPRHNASVEWQRFNYPQLPYEDLLKDFFRAKREQKT